MKQSFSEIAQLKNYQKDHSIRVELLGSKESLLQVMFHSSSGSWEIFIEDEYHDFEESNQLICIYLCLRSLEDYVEEPDFLTWSNLYGIDDFDPFWLDYYRGLAKIRYEIEFHLGEIDSFINSLDYELRSGAIHELTKNKGNRE